jgi:hypothetical protein
MHSYSVSKKKKEETCSFQKPEFYFQTPFCLCKNLAKFVAKIIAMKECCNEQTFPGEIFLSRGKALKKVNINVIRNLPYTRVVKCCKIN